MYALAFTRVSQPPKMPETNRSLRPWLRHNCAFGVLAGRPVHRHPTLRVFALGLDFPTDLAVGLETLCRRWNVKEDVAGATFMAVGSAAPEIVINVIAAIQAGTSDNPEATKLGVSAIIGSGMVAFLLAPGLCVRNRSVVLDPPSPPPPSSIPTPLECSRWWWCIRGDLVGARPYFIASWIGHCLSSDAVLRPARWCCQAIYANEPLVLKRNPLIRDIVAYLVAVIALVLFISNDDEVGEIDLGEAIILAMIWVIYIIVTVFGPKFKKWVRVQLSGGGLSINADAPSSGGGRLEFDEGPEDSRRTLVSNSSYDNEAGGDTYEDDLELMAMDTMLMEESVLDADINDIAKGIEGDDDDDDDEKAAWLLVISWPLRMLFMITCPNAEEGHRHERFYGFTVLISFVWVAVFSFLIMSLLTNWSGGVPVILLGASVVSLSILVRFSTADLFLFWVERRGCWLMQFDPPHLHHQRYHITPRLRSEERSQTRSSRWLWPSVVLARWQLPTALDPRLSMSASVLGSLGSCRS